MVQSINCSENMEVWKSWKIWKKWIFRFQLNRNIICLVNMDLLEFNVRDLRNVETSYEPTLGTLGTRSQGLGNRLRPTSLGDLRILQGLANHILQGLANLHGHLQKGQVKSEQVRQYIVQKQSTTLSTLRILQGLANRHGHLQKGQVKSEQVRQYIA